MSKKILITYASVSGSTGEVAAAISKVLEKTGVTVQVQPVKDIVDVSSFDAVVLGSSIRAGRWLPEATQFLAKHRDSLIRVPVAYFTTCLTMVNDTEDSRRTVLAYIEPVLEQVPEIKPVALGLFAGSLDPNRTMVMQTKVAPQGDYRDWDAIRAWAKEIRPALLGGSLSSRQSIALRGAILRHANMSGAELGRADLSGSDLREANLTEADLHEANLSDANLRGAKLQKADMDRVSLRKAGLNWANMNSANMSGADLSMANLIGAHLKQANLSEAILSQATLNGANLSHANLSGANLSRADLNWADLSHADLRRADLSEANLGWANLSGANLSEARFSNAKYNRDTRWPEDFSAEEQGCILVER